MIGEIVAVIIGIIIVAFIFIKFKQSQRRDY